MMSPVVSAGWSKRGQGVPLHQRLRQGPDGVGPGPAGGVGRSVAAPAEEGVPPGVGCVGADGSGPPWSSRKGGYASVIRAT